MDKDLKKVSTDESCKESALRKAHKWGVEEVESRESFWFLKKMISEKQRHVYGGRSTMDYREEKGKIASAYS